MTLPSMDFLSLDQKESLEEILKKYPKKFEKAAMREVLYHCINLKMGDLKIHEMVKSLSYYFGVPSRFLTEILRNDLGYKNQNTKALYNVEVCMNLPCVLRGSGDIMKTCEKWLDLPCGSKTVDNYFSLCTASCLVRCTKGPVALINGVEKEELTTTQMVFWLQSLLQDERSTHLNEKAIVRNPYASTDTE